MIRAVITFNETGECELDTKKAIKYWNLLCRIYEHNGIFRLVQFTPKGKCKLKVQISVQDAHEIIEQLYLKRIQDDFFKNTTIYSI